MTIAEQSVTGERVRFALQHARDLAQEDPDKFRRTEMSWLEENMPGFKLKIQEGFAERMRGGREAGESYMSGKLLASYIIRSTFGEDANFAYIWGHYLEMEERDDTYIRNKTLPHQKLPNWDNPELLGQVFVDPDLVNAFMEIRHSGSRSAAAVAIAFFCLSDIPEAAYKPLS